MTWRSKRIETESSCRCAFSFECKIIFRKPFFGSPGDEDSITKIAKVRFRLYMHFFTIFAFVLAKKLTHRQVRPRNVAVLISQSIVHLNGKLALSMNIVRVNSLVRFDLIRGSSNSWKLIGGFSSKVRETVTTTTATTENKEGKMKIKIQIDEKESRNKKKKRKQKMKLRRGTTECESRALDVS